MSKRHLELRIAYLKWQISQLPHGFVTQKGGKEYVCLFYDPQNPAVSRENKKRYLASTDRGHELLILIKKYLAVKNDLDNMLKIWKTTYIGSPRPVLRFPLKKTQPDRFDHEFFNNAIPNQNPHENETPIEYDGQVFRSKNELIGALILDKLGYEYKTEVMVRFDQYARFFADFIIYIPEIDKVIILEIDGAIDKIEYITKSYRNTASCVINGLTEMKDFVVVRIGDPRNINVQQIENMLYAAIEASIDDIVFEEIGHPG